MAFPSPSEPLAANHKKRKPGSSFEEPGYKPGNNLLSRDLTSNYHWLLGA
jgi:hypothetical protein